MPAPAETTRISVRGNIGTSDIFNWSVWLCGTLIDSEEKANQVALDFADSLTNHAAGILKGILVPTSAYQEVRTYAYPTGGTQSQFIGSANLESFSGTSSAAPLPLDTCLVASLRTGRAGRSNRGRSYLPANALAVDGTGNFSLQDATNVGNAFAAVLTDMNTKYDPGFIGVVSFTRTLNNPVTEVVTDTKPDVQRRRMNRNAASETVISPV